MFFSVRERTSLPVFIEAQRLVEATQEDAPLDALSKVEITFELVAKFEFHMLNFWEHMYGQFEIKEETSGRFGFYHILNSSWNILTYDPMKRLKLSHFLLT